MLNNNNNNFHICLVLQVGLWRQIPSIRVELWKWNGGTARVPAPSSSLARGDEKELRKKAPSIRPSFSDGPGPQG